MYFQNVHSDEMLDICGTNMHLFHLLMLKLLHHRDTSELLHNILDQSAQELKNITLLWLELIRRICRKIWTN